MLRQSIVMKSSVLRATSDIETSNVTMLESLPATYGFISKSLD